MVRWLEANGYHKLTDGEVIATEGATLVAMHTPGHAADHACFLLEEEGSLFSGDNILGWGTCWVQSLSEYMTTLTQLERLQPPTVYPGHGPVITDGPERLKKYIDHRTAREEQVSPPAIAWYVCMHLGA